MMKFVSLGLFLVVMVGCTSNPTRKYRPQGDRTLLFPQGQYRHEVSLEMGPQKQLRQVEGIVQLSPNRTIVAGLSPMGLTLFKIIHDKPTDTLKIDFFIPGFESHKEKVRVYFKILENLFNLPFVKDQPPPQTIEVSVDGENHSVQFEKYDNNTIPERFRISGPKVLVTIFVSAYEVH